MSPITQCFRCFRKRLADNFCARSSGTPHGALLRCCHGIQVKRATMFRNQQILRVRHVIPNANKLRNTTHMTLMSTKLGMCHWRQQSAVVGAGRAPYHLDLMSCAVSLVPTMKFGLKYRKFTKRICLLLSACNNDICSFLP